MASSKSTTNKTSVRAAAASTSEEHYASCKSSFVRDRVFTISVTLYITFAQVSEKVERLFTYLLDYPSKGLARKDTIKIGL